MNRISLRYARQGYAAVSLCTPVFRVLCFFRADNGGIVAPIVVTATLGTSQVIITEAYLSFLGFGVQPPTATWGNILTGAQDRIDTVWWLWMAPGFFIVASVLAINFIGDGLRDALDPRSIR